MADNGIELATAWVRLVPSFEGVSQNITQAFAPGAKTAAAEGDKAGRGWSKRAKAAIGTAAIGTAIVGAFKGLYDVGAMFDDVTDTIRVGTGAQGDALNGLVDVAKNVGQNVPAEFSKIGPTVADLNTRLGLSGSTLETVSSQYLEAGRILGEDVDINATTAAFSAFKIEGDQVSGAMDSLFQVSQATGVGMNDLASGVQAAAPALTNLGFSFEDSISLMGSLDKAGMNSTQVLASMSKGLVTLAKDGEQPEAAFQRVVGELQGFVDVGDTASALDLASQVFGTRGASQFVGALQSGALNMNDLMAATGATGDTILGVGAETMDFAERWQMTMNTAMVALEPLATAVFTALGEGLQNAMPFLQELGAWVATNTETIGIIAGVIGVTLVAAFVAWTASIWASTAAMLANPITWIILAVVALIAAIVALVMNWDAVVAWISTVWAGFITWITGVINSFASWWSGIWKNITSFFSNLWKSIASFFTGLWNNLVSWFQQKIAFWKLVFDTALNAISSFWTTTWNNITGFFRGIWNGIVSWFQEKIAFWQTVFRLSLAILRDTWQNIWNGIKTFFSNIWNGIKSVFMTMIDFVKTKPAEAFRAARDAIGKAWKGIQELAKKPVRFVIDTVINGLIGTVNKIPGVNIPKVPLPKGFAHGGILPGMSRMGDGDDQLIAARRGEGIMVSEALRSSADRAAFLAVNDAGRRGVGFASLLEGFARGGLVNPLPRGSYSVSQPYHAGHNGIDLAAPGGTKIFAAADGVVGLAGSVPMGGNEVYVQHANGLGTRYSHLSRFATSVGTQVKAGHVIGYVGSTGMSTGDHLHYMVHDPGGGAGNYGNHVNPAPYLGIFGKDLGEAGGAASILDGLVDWAASKIKGAFPEGGMWIDVASGLAKNTASTMAKVLNPFAAADGHTGHTTLFDNGGWLPTGVSLVENKTGSPEPVFTPSQWSTLHAAVEAPERGDGAAVAYFYDADGVLMGTIDGRIAEASAGASARVLNDRLGVG